MSLNEKCFPEAQAFKHFVPIGGGVCRSVGVYDLAGQSKPCGVHFQSKKVFPTLSLFCLGTAVERCQLSAPYSTAPPCCQALPALQTLTLWNHESE